MGLSKPLLYSDSMISLAVESGEMEGTFLEDFSYPVKPCKLLQVQTQKIFSILVRKHWRYES
jgi:hypothetical protein